MGSSVKKIVPGLNVAAELPFSLMRGKGIQVWIGRQSTKQAYPNTVIGVKGTYVCSGNSADQVK